MSFIAQSEEALIAAIRAGVVPDEVLYAPVCVHVDDEGLHIAPDADVPADTQRRLEQLGFRSSDPAEGRRVDSWPQIIEARRTGDPLPEIGRALFVAPRERFGDLVGTLLRLGADRQEVAFFDGEICATKVVDPPYYVTLSAAERGEVRGYTALEDNPRVWIELGYEHPLASFFVVPDDELLLIGERWTRLKATDDAWRSIYAHLDLAVPGGHALSPIESDLRLKVVLRLVPATQSPPPSLWILRDPRVLDALVASMPEAALRAFAFARLRGNDAELIAIRSRTGHEAAPLELPEAEAYVSVRDVDNLFVPRGFAIHPPLRRERLRDALAPDVDALWWLVPDGSHVEHAPAAAFRPLTEWVDHVAAEDAVGLQPWLDAAIFELDDFVGVEMTAPALAPVVPTVPKKPSAASPKPAKPNVEQAPEPAAKREMRAKPIEVQASTPTALQREIDEVEGRLIDLLGGNNVYRTTRDDIAPEWRLLGALYAEAGRTRDAALAFAHALWMLEPSDSQWRAVLRRWATAEDVPERFETDRARGEIVGALLAMSGGEAIDAAAMRALLAAHGDAIPARIAWLAQEAIARHTQDQLGFVRAQDAMRVRLRGGLRIADDVPGFIRRQGQAMSGRASVRLVEALVEARASYEATERARSSAEAPANLTDGYVGWLFAWGFAHLGESAHSSQQTEAAERSLTDADDDVHAYLRAAFRTRVEHARTGRGLHVALPFELHAQLEALSRMERYKVDRLREASHVLEGGAVDAFGAFREDAERLEIDSPGDLTARVDAAIGDATSASLARAGALLQLMPPYDALPRFEAYFAAVLEQPDSTWPARVDDALLMLTTARHFKYQTECINVLVKLLAEADSTIARDAARVLNRHAFMVAPYRYGQAARAAEARLPELSGDALAHLELATLLASMGNAGELANAAQRAVTIQRPRDWLAWHRRHALALAQISPEHAIEGTREAMKSLARVTDSFQTNSHFCLSVLHFVESIVLGLARADLALSSEARRIIDADEQLVRQRIFARPFLGPSQETP